MLEEKNKAMKKILKFLYYITPSLIISASIGRVTPQSDAILISASILVGAILICKSIEAVGNWLVMAL